MEVRKFEAKSMQEALKMVKEQLGPDAIILSSRSRNKSFGIGGDQSIEITAAISEQKLNERNYALSRVTEQNKKKLNDLPARYEKKFIEKSVSKYKQENQPAKPITARQYIDIDDEERSRKSENKNSSVRKTDSSTYVSQGRRQQLKDLIDTPSAKKMIGHSVDSLIDEDVGKRRVKQAARNALNSVSQDWLEDPPKRKQPSSSAALSRGAPRASEVNELKQEIANLRNIIHSFQNIPQQFIGSHPGADFGIHYDLSFMFEKLVDIGVDEDIASDMLQLALKEVGPKQCKKRSLVEAWVARRILDTVPICAENNTKPLEVFIGSNASGKTSTLIKYASNLVVYQRKKIAIVSTDSVKVGAFEQMKIFAQILNVPFVVIKSGQDWQQVLNRFRDVDCILVDTPGVSLKDLNEIDILRSLLPPKELNPRIHFVQRASVMQSSAEELTRRFKMFAIDDIIFTHLDECSQYGLVYNLSCKFKLPIHSFGIGKNIPEDFELATRERVLDLLFQLTKAIGA